MNVSLVRIKNKIPMKKKHERNVKNSVVLNIIGKKPIDIDVEEWWDE